jgi:hypothetical protein
MTSYSKSRFILLNVLVIVFTMNAVLAHSACFMDMASAEQNANVEMNMHNGNMPCHTQDSSQADGPGESTESTKKECCSVCSVMVITVDSAKPFTATHTDKIDVTLDSSITRTLEIPFRPPINHLS